MPTTTSPQRLRWPTFAAAAVGVLGLVMMILGAVAYGFTSSQLRAQNITVAAVTAEDPGPLAGQTVADPFTAMAQAAAIDHHMLTSTKGETYATLGNVASKNGATYSRDVPQEASVDGVAHSAGEPLSKADAATYSARATAQQGALLEAALYVSVLAFGMSALSVGVGALFVLVGVVMWRVSNRAFGPRAADASQNPAPA